MNIINLTASSNPSYSAPAISGGGDASAKKRKAQGLPEQSEAEIPFNPNAMQIDVPPAGTGSTLDRSSTPTWVGNSAKKQKSSSPLDIVETKADKIQRIHQELKDLWQGFLDIAQAESLKAIPRSFQSLHLGFDQYPAFSNVYALADKIEAAAKLALLRYQGKDKLEAVIAEKNKELKSLLQNLTPARKDHKKAGIELLHTAIRYEQHDLIKDLLKHFELSAAENYLCMQEASKTTPATVKLLLANGCKIQFSGYFAQELPQKLFKMALSLNDSELLLTLCQNKFIIDRQFLITIRKFPMPLLTVFLANADFSLVPEMWIYFWFKECLNNDEIDIANAIYTKFPTIVWKHMEFTLFIECVHKRNYGKLRYLISIGCKDKSGEALVNAVALADRELVDMIKPVSNPNEALVFYITHGNINTRLKKHKKILDVLLELGASLHCRSNPSLLVSFVDSVAKRKGEDLNCTRLRWFIENGAEVGNVPPQYTFWSYIVSHPNSEVFAILKPQFAKVPQQEQVKMLNKALMDLFQKNFELTDVRRLIERGARNIGEAYYELQDFIMLDEEKAEQLDGEKKNGRMPRKNSKLYKKIQESKEIAEDNKKIKNFLVYNLRNKIGVDDLVDFPEGIREDCKFSMVPSNKTPVKTPLLLAYYALNYKDEFEFFLSCGADPSLTDSRGFGLFTYSIVNFLQSYSFLPVPPEEFRCKELMEEFSKVMKIIQRNPSSRIYSSDFFAFILISLSLAKSFPVEALIKADISLSLLLKTYEQLSQIECLKPLLVPVEVLVERLVKCNPKHIAHSLKLRSFTEAQMKEIQGIDPIEELVKMSTAINFNARMLPYMTPQRRMTAEELTAHFFVLVDRLRQEIPMLGTPPAADTVKVKKFYQELKEKVAVLAFSCRDSAGKYDQDKIFALVCNLGESAKVCGAGWAGEIQEMYFAYMTEGETLSLAGKIYAALAKRRKKIVHDWAKAVTAQNPGNEAHYYLAVLQHFGSQLGIPGAEKVTEHLAKITPEASASFNNYWGRHMNAKALIDWMCALIAENKDPAIKREAVLDWMKETLVQDWRLQDFKFKFSRMRDRLFAFNSIGAKTLPADKIEAEFLKLLREAAITPNTEPQIILTDYLNSIERLLKEKGTLQEKFNSIMDIVVNAAEATRKSEFLATLHNEDYSLKRFAVIQMLERLEIIQVRTNSNV